MQTLVSKKQKPVIKVLPAQPSLLITMPFEPKLAAEKQLQERVKTVAKKAEKMLLSQYSITEARQVTELLSMVFRKLNFDCFKKSIAVFISASSHKVIYLNLRLREEIQLNSSFQISDLIELKEEPVEYLA